ncbi:DUF3783 domain-containing protein [Petrocella sp. FN5]|uniref:DUF3783 domain-containing protein n=1 Tax=Petrocella sp. FN5 TaxID=3032002 RepID=UPI0023DB362D|nr:DUF3783 domain-containing protein [Petrocella sp. FN5]MDF1616266.1 DUF3783 domain-containing protein [Petrocella sp. FN5]
MAFEKIDYNNNNRPEGKTCLLVYGYDETALDKIKNYASNYDIFELVLVTPTTMGNALERLINHTDKPTFGIEWVDTQAIVLNAVSPQELNDFVRNFKTLGLPRPLFAVVTPLSINWPFNELLKDLLDERAMIASKQKQSKKD